MNPRWELQDHAWSRTWMALFAGHHEGFALESGEWLMSTFRCAANGAVHSWISQIQIPGKPGRPTSSGPAWTAVATFGRHIPPRRRPMRSSGPMDRGNATLATTPRASCLRVPQVLVCNGARDTRLDRDVALRSSATSPSPKTLIDWSALSGKTKSSPHSTTPRERTRRFDGKSQCVGYFRPPPHCLPASKTSSAR